MYFELKCYQNKTFLFKEHYSGEKKKRYEICLYNKPFTFYKTLSMTSNSV